MSKYYIKFGISANPNAGSKAMKDIMAMLDSKGYKAVLALPTRTNKIIKLIDIPILLFTLCFRVGRNGTVLYFVPSNFQRIKLLKFFNRIIRFKLICFINDIESMRMEKSKEYAHAEMNSIAVADIILAPNDNSIQILQNKYHFTNHLVSIGIWDYLNNFEPIASEHTTNMVFNEKSVAFAGNLNKAPFINELSSVNLNFKIWGSNTEEKKDRNIEFMGKKAPDELIENISQCTWGLVWDGISINTCCGLLGTYLRFNNSHKCGLYLAARVPVIVWEESGMASFVNKYKVGICVSSLHDAADIINCMDQKVYNIYKKNAQSIGQLISEGKFFLEALEKAEKITN